MVKSGLRNFRYLFILSLWILASCSSETTSGTNPNAVFDLFGNAVTSAANAGGEGLGVTPKLINFDFSVDANCDEHGYPLDDIGDPVDEGADEYAAMRFYCIMRQPGNDPGTILGAMSLVSGISCAIQSFIAFTGTPVTATVTLDNSCFSEEFLTDVGDGTTFEATITTSQNGTPLFGNADDWDYSLQIDFADFDSGNPSTVKMLFKASDDIYAAAVLPQVSGHQNDGFAFYLNTATGVTRFESQHQRYSEDSGDSSSGWSRHARLLIEGLLDATTGTYTALTNIEGVNSELYDNMPDTSTLMTIKGNPTDGFATQNLKFSGAQADFDTFEDDVIIFCAGGSCTGNDGIVIDTLDDFDFIMHPDNANFVTTSSWYDDLALLSYTEVTTAINQ